MKPIQQILSTIKVPAAQIISRSWPPFSHLIIKGDESGWVLDEISRELSQICRRLGIKTVGDMYDLGSRNQSVYLTSKYFLNNWKIPRHRLAFPYFHGDPRKDESFTPIFDNLVMHQNKITKIQVSHSEMEALLLNSGVTPNKVHRIPISINLERFPSKTEQTKAASRKWLKIPESAVLVGSFQKDGIGFGVGNKPKFIKGPDIFLKTIELLDSRVAELHVLLTGPARGYVKKGLTERGIPFTHVLLKDYSDVSKCYLALDSYLVSSREEGGPRAVLESMASGVPLVTTRVGQAMDLVDHGANGWITEIGDFEALAHWLQYAIENTNSIKNVLAAARQTAVENCYAAQVPLWKNFMEGFVELPLGQISTSH